MDFTKRLLNYFQDLLAKFGLNVLNLSLYKYVLNHQKFIYLLNLVVFVMVGYLCLILLIMLTNGLKNNLLQLLLYLSQLNLIYLFIVALLKILHPILVETEVFYYLHLLLFFRVPSNKMDGLCIAAKKNR